MADPFPSVAELTAEEEELQLTSFTHLDAWDLGSALVAAGRRDGLPIAVDITRNRHQLFHAALPGATPDNDSWLRRKTRVVNRFGHSSLLVGQASRERGTTFEAEFGLDPGRYAAHGGAVPLLVRAVGAVGVVAVSGLPQVEDHRLVVATLREHLRR
ncbi:MAG: heme-degrading domain-containing protein [Blastococcus sp.]